MDMAIFFRKSSISNNFPDNDSFINKLITPIDIPNIKLKKIKISLEIPAGLFNNVGVDISSQGSVCFALSSFKAANSASNLTNNFSFKVDF